MKQCPKCGFKEVKKIYLDGFDTFWVAYPRRVGKGAARKQWSKIKPDGLMLGQMLTALDEQKATECWKKDNGMYIPHPSTWLSQERWLDETQRKKEVPKVVTEEMRKKAEENEQKLERLREREIQRLHGEVSK